MYDSKNMPLALNLASSEARRLNGRSQYIGLCGAFTRYGGRRNGTNRMVGPFRERHVCSAASNRILGAACRMTCHAYAPKGVLCNVSLRASGKNPRLYRSLGSTRQTFDVGDFRKATSKRVSGRCSRYTSQSSEDIDSCACA